MNVNWPYWLSCDVLIGLKTLQPNTSCPLVPPMDYRNLIAISSEISGNVQIAAIVASRESYLRLGIGSLTASDHYGPDGES